MSIQNIFNKIWSHTFLQDSSQNITQDPNLAQGKQLLNFTNKYNDILKPHLQELQLTTSPNLSTIVESLDTDESINGYHVQYNSKISKLENKFNHTLSEYKKINDQINQVIINNENDIPQHLWKHIHYLNKKLICITNDITKEINSIVTQDIKLKNKLIEQKTQLTYNTDNLIEDQNNIKNMYQNIQNSIGYNEDSQLKMRSASLYYIIWLFLAITIICILIYTIYSSNEPYFAQVIILITLLIILFIIARWIYRYYL